MTATATRRSADEAGTDADVCLQDASITHHHNLHHPSDSSGGGSSISDKLAKTSLEE
jgi:hypothetical protein